MKKIEIKNLNVSVEGKQILKNLSITFEAGKVYALVGPNGNGKSTLLSTIMGDPDYTVDSGSILIDGQDIVTLPVDERAKLGVYLGMQYPPEVSGIKNIDLIIAAKNARDAKKNSSVSLYLSAEKEAHKLRLSQDILERDVNVGFSGGEKKKNELLHMKMLNPSLILLDEIDSGLDIDSIESISYEIKNMKSADKCFVIISHYQKMFENIGVDEVIVIKNGDIHSKGDSSLLSKILDGGFDGI